MFYKNMKTMVCSLGGDTVFFYIVTRVLQGYISPIYIFNLSRLRTVNGNRSNERRWFHMKKDKK